MRKRVLKKGLVIGIILLFVGASVVPGLSVKDGDRDIIYVDDDNTGGPWDGTQEHPYQYIQDGIDNAGSSDMIFVFNGSYYEEIFIDTTVNLVGENRYGTVINNSGYGDVITITADNVEIGNFTIIGGGDWDVDSLAGIIIYSDNNSIYNCDIRTNSTDDYSNVIQLSGIYLSSSDNNLIDNCYIHSHFYDSIGSGIYLTGSTNNVISNCEIANNDRYGIRIEDYSNLNRIYGNIIRDHIIWGYGIGIFISSSSYNTIYHNNFFNNIEHAEDSSVNIWDDGYPSGGNYWDDYTGSDNYHGVDQNIPGSDGIGDIPYNIPGGSNQDRYPLMNPTCTISTVYVDDDYDTSTPGWSYDHFDTIQDGIDAVNVGGTVFVFTGTYYENIVLKNQVDVIGDGANSTYIIGYRWGDVITANNVSDGLVRGFSISINSPFPGLSAFVMKNSSSLVFERNIVYDNYLGISISTGSTGVIQNNVIYTGVTALTIDNSSPVVKNTIIMNCDTGVHVAGNSTPVMGYNDVFNCSLNYSGISSGIGDISQDPLFVAPNNNYFQLQPGSPCIDAGDPFDPVPPGGGQRVDMGTFEYLSTGYPPEITYGPSVNVLSNTTVEVLWGTDKVCNSTVLYGQEEGHFSDVTSETDFVINHVVELINLEPSSTYRYKVISYDIMGNPIESIVHYFTTNATIDYIPPTLEVEVPSTIYGPTPVIVTATDNVGIDRIEFYVNNEFQYAAFADKFQWTFDPSDLPNGMHNLMVKAYDKAGGMTPMQMVVYVEIAALDDTPPAGGIITPSYGDNVSGSNVQIEAWGLDPESGIGKMVFYVDDELLHIDYINGVPGDDDHSIYYWNSFGTPNGENHEIKVEIYNNAGYITPVTTMVEVYNTGSIFDEYLDPFYVFKLMKLTRGQVKREGVYYEAKLYVQNLAPFPLYNVVVNDTHCGFQAIQSDYGYEPRVRFNPDTSSSTVSFSIGNLMPNEIKTLVITMSLVLFTPNPMQIDYTIGKETVVTYMREIAPNNYQIAELCYHVPAVKTIEGWWGTDEILLTTENILAPVKNCDYLVVTHPRNLYNLNDDIDVDALLSKCADFVKHKYAVLAYLDSADPRTELETAIEQYFVFIGFQLFFIKGCWNKLLRSDWATYGYMLIVGETEIVPSFDVHMTVSTGEYDVPLSDNPYADLNGDNLPDISVGRIIGNNAEKLRIPLETSLGVFYDNPGYHFDASDALLISGIGKYYKGFVSNINEIATITNQYLTPQKIHWKDSFIMDTLPIETCQADDLALAELGWTADAEIIIADSYNNRIKIYDNMGFFCYEFVFNFESEDEIIAGDIMGDSKPEIIIADTSNNMLYIYHCWYYMDPYGGYWDSYLITTISTNLILKDTIAIGDILGSEKQDIIISDTTNSKIIIRHHDTGNNFFYDYFSCNVPLNHALAAGNLNSDEKDIIVLGEYDLGFPGVGDKFYLYNGAGTLIAQFTRDFNFGNQMAIGNVIGDGIDDICIMDGIANRVYYCYLKDHTNWNLPNETHTPIEIPTLLFDKILVGQIISGDRDEVLIEEWVYNYLYYYNHYHGTRGYYVFRAHAGEKDIIHFNGHGGATGWSPSLYGSHFPIDFDGTNPAMLGFTCSSGNYKPKKGTAIAESAIANGAGLFIGSTRMSNTGINGKAGIVFYRDFYRPYKNFGKPFKDMKRCLWSFSESYYRWVLEYNIYGDPKYGPPPTLIKKPSGSINPPLPPITNVTIDFPMYNVTTEEDIDYVEIPGEPMLIIPGQYEVPYSTRLIKIPQGYQVQDVLMTDRSNLTYDTGLNLSVVPDDFLETCTGEPPYIQNYTWYPDKDYEWNIMHNISGNNTLVLIVYPFFYNTNTTDVHYFSHYEFSISYVETSVKINEVQFNKSEYVPGEILDGMIELNNTADDNQTVLVKAVVESYVGGQYTDGLPLHLFELRPGKSAVYFSWESIGIPSGDYKLHIEIENTNGEVQDTATEHFSIGSTKGYVTNFSATPTVFNISEIVHINMTFKNTGTTNISGLANITIKSSNGEIIEVFNHTFDELAPYDSIIFENNWNTSDNLPDTYTVLAYVLFGSSSAVAQSFTVQEFSMVDRRDKTFMGVFPSFSSVVVGEKFNETIYIDPHEGISGWNINISFTPGLLNAIDVNPGSLWMDLFNPGTIDNENGTITFIQSQATTSYPDMNHTACVINFTSNNSGMCHIQITYANVTNASFLPIAIYLEEAFVEIGPNSPPELYNEYPEDGETDVDVDANLSWIGSDPDGDNVTYDVYFGTTSPPPQVAWNQSETTYDPPGDMDYDTIYYWNIVAWDEHGLNNASDEWQFTTEPAPNNPPYQPSDPNPEDDEVNVPIDAMLSWTGGDPDGDNVTYDVYFGTTSPPPPVVWNQSETTYDPPGDLEFGTVYYWQIVAWDEHGLNNVSDEWHFITVQAVPDLDCDGSLGWTDVEPGATVEGSFTVENIGDSTSELDWMIESYPEWGTWIFDPDSGEDLTPEAGITTVEVEVVAPDESETEFTGEVKIVNSEDPSDYCIIPVSLITPVSQNEVNSQLLQFIHRFIERFPLLEQIPASHPIFNRIMNFQ